MPGAGVPRAVSRTCVVSRPMAAARRRGGGFAGAARAIVCSARAAGEACRALSMTSPAAAYPRDLVGYGETPPHARWPGGARIALQFVLNYEEGGENSVLHGDEASETFLSEIVGAQAFRARHLSMESLYEYGSRAGVWRLLRLFREREVPLTVFGVAMAMQRHPAVVEAFLRDGHEIASHGWRWISYQAMDEATEREHLRARRRRRSAR